MRLFPAHFGDLRRNDDAAPGPEPKDESREEVFRLIPPRAEAFVPPGAGKPLRPEGFPRTETAKLGAGEQVSRPAETRSEEPPGAEKEVATLSIDHDGGLSWDGKPVEVRWRLVMSGGQVFAATLIGLFLIVSGLGAAIQGSATAHGFACRLGWIEAQCAIATPRAPDFPT